MIHWPSTPQASQVIRRAHTIAISLLYGSKGDTSRWFIPAQRWKGSQSARSFSSRQINNDRVSMRMSIECHRDYRELIKTVVAFRVGVGPAAHQNRNSLLESDRQPGPRPAPQASVVLRTDQMCGLGSFSDLKATYSLLGYSIRFGHTPVLPQMFKPGVR